MGNHPQQAQEGSTSDPGREHGRFRDRRPGSTIKACADPAPRISAAEASPNHASGRRGDARVCRGAPVARAQIAGPGPEHHARADHRRPRDPHRKRQRTEDPATAFAQPLDSHRHPPQAGPASTGPTGTSASPDRNCSPVEQKLAWGEERAGLPNMSAWWASQSVSGTTTAPPIKPL